MDVRGVASIVTGGASGIGEATARLLARRGARCVIVDRDEARGAKVASDVGGVFSRVDVANADEVSAAVELAASLGPVRVLVNAAGIGYSAPTLDCDGTPQELAKFEKLISVNLIGTFNCIRLVAAAMARGETLDDDIRGAIVNIASVAAFDGQNGQAGYSASKGGVVSMTLPIARDLASTGIRINTVAPGVIDTPIHGRGEKSEAFKEALARGVLLPRRLGHADEIASMVLEVITNDYMNGETIRVDAGIRVPPK